jgi:phthalate 4,5-dioxygenase oxygenase subunit
VLDGAKALMDGTRPEAAFRHESYRLRSGSWIGHEGVPFEQVMLERFGHRVGRVVTE